METEILSITFSRDALDNNDFIKDCATFTGMTADEMWMQFSNSIPTSMTPSMLELYTYLHGDIPANSIMCFPEAGDNRLEEIFKKHSISYTTEGRNQKIDRVKKLIEMFAANEATALKKRGNGFWLMVGTVITFFVLLSILPSTQIIVLFVVIMAIISFGKGLFELMQGCYDTRSRGWGNQGGALAVIKQNDPRTYSIAKAFYPLLSEKAIDNFSAASTQATQNFYKGLLIGSAVVVGAAGVYQINKNKK